MTPKGSGAQNFVATTPGNPNHNYARTSAGDARFSAEAQAHALVLTYFSRSPEFLGDVQITAAHPADSQHWLYLA